MLLGPIHVEYPVEREVIRGTLIESTLIYNGTRVRGLHEHSRPRAFRETTRGRRLLGHCPLIPPRLPAFCLAQSTSHSFFFVNNIYMEATPSPAERSRTILDILSEILAHPFFTMSTEEKPVLHTRAKEGFDDSSCVRGLRP